MAVKKNKSIKSGEKTFEENFSQLEKILQKLENEDVSLDETLKLYEEGLTLTKLCYEKLTNSELRINEINKTLKNDLVIRSHKKDNGI